MPFRKFHVGEIVKLERTMARNLSGGAYKVIKQLPETDGGEFEYRIKSANEPYERVARESEMHKA